MYGVASSSRVHAREQTSHDNTQVDLSSAIFVPNAQSATAAAAAAQRKVQSANLHISRQLTEVYRAASCECMMSRHRGRHHESQERERDRSRSPQAR